MRRPRRPRHVELIAISGNPVDDELRAIEQTIERLVDAGRTAAESSLWLRSGRAQGRRLGMFDYRDRFTREDAWRLSVRMPFGGREYPGLNGRADAR